MEWCTEKEKVQLMIITRTWSSGQMRLWQSKLSAWVNDQQHNFCEHNLSGSTKVWKFKLFMWSACGMRLIPNYFKFGKSVCKNVKKIKHDIDIYIYLSWSNPIAVLDPVTDEVTLHWWYSCCHNYNCFWIWCKFINVWCHLRWISWTV